MRKRIKDIRREELLQATLETIHSEGLQNITVAKLSAKAGMSQGMVHHYFKNKAEIIEAAIRYVNAQLRTDLVTQVQQVKTPEQRLQALIDVNFSTRWYNLETTRLWVSFCAEVPFNHTFFRIQRVIHQRMQSNLLSCLKPLLNEQKAKQVSTEISNLIDGLWIRASVGQAQPCPEEAKQVITAYLKQQGIPTGN